MPELPEVETTCRGIHPHVVGQKICSLNIRTKKLRWPIPRKIINSLPQQTILNVKRRAKYLLFRTEVGTLIIHLGMSGSLRVLPVDTAPQKHDHFDLEFNEILLRLRDPRKFGAVLWTEQDPNLHPLLVNLGPEPLDKKDFHPDYLYIQSRKRTVAVKNFIMNANVVVGVGNIYATEALFMSGIHPTRAANNISKQRYQSLTSAIRSVLRTAIKKGGTTLRDFTNEDGKPGYFRHELKVYGRVGQACVNCERILKAIKIGQRTSTYCQHCQR